MNREPARLVKRADRPVIFAVEVSGPPRLTSVRIAAAFTRTQLADMLICNLA